MQKLIFAYPGDLETPTGGYGYDRRIVAGLEDLGWQVGLVSLGEGFPFPTDMTLDVAQRRLSSLPAGSTVVVDGLAFGVMQEAARDLGNKLSLVALVHHPLCQENGLKPDQARSLRESEHAVLAQAKHVIVTSPATAQQVEDLFGVDGADISVILPGTDLPGQVERAPSETVRLLSVGTLVPRKGHDLLLEALAGIAPNNWILDIVGGLEADPVCARSLMQQAADLGLSEKVTFRGALHSSDLIDLYQHADVFVLASRYEGYGMAFTEALAHGLPVIGSGGGAVGTTLPEDASIYCKTEDVGELRDALDRLVSSSEERSFLSNAARKAARDLPSWKDASRQFADVLQGVAA